MELSFDDWRVVATGDYVRGTPATLTDPEDPEFVDHIRVWLYFGKTVGKSIRVDVTRHIPMDQLAVIHDALLQKYKDDGLY